MAADIDERWQEKANHSGSPGLRLGPSMLRRALNPIWWTTMIFNAVRSLLFSLVPQFEDPSQTNVAGRRSSPTAFLDGLRGIAAFIVMIHHFSKDPFPWLPWGWGSMRNEIGQYHFLQLPIIRIIHSGPAMVAVFFVISGFALSYSPLKKIRRKDTGALGTTLASSTFRRTLRLYLPCVATTLFMVIAMQFGAAPFPHHRKTEANIIAELYRWVISMWHLLNPFDLSFHLPRYDDNLWTIPAELRGSLALFIVILGVARLRYRIRLIVESVITAWFYSYGLWDVGLFTSGLVLAELHLEREERWTSPLPAPSSPRPSSMPPSSLRKRLSLPLVFLLSLFLSSAPLLGYAKSPYYKLLSSLAPPSWAAREVTDRWIPTLGAPLLVYCADRSRKMRGILTSPIGAYLGRISFGLYLVHGPIRYTVYHPVLEIIMRSWGLKVVTVEEETKHRGGWLKTMTWIPKVAEHVKDKAEKAKIHQEDLEANNWRFLAAVFITWAVLAPITFAVADWFSRTVDRGSVRLARNLETKWMDEGFATASGSDVDQATDRSQIRSRTRTRSESRRREADEEWEMRQRQDPGMKSAV